jgi:hypothetical protein
MSKRDAARVTTYLPPETKRWIAEQAERNYTSLTVEIVRSIHERLEEKRAG